MFNIGWVEFLVLAAVGLFILGPERLPSAAAWLGRAVRQMREFASGARDQLRSELGPEFDELQKPLQDLRSVRNFNPRRAVTQHLLDGFDDKPFKPNGRDSQTSASKPATRPLAEGERPPFDSDAT